MSDLTKMLAKVVFLFSDAVGLSGKMELSVMSSVNICQCLSIVSLR